MSFKDTYPQYAAIEAHIRHARVERSVAIAALLTDAILAVGRGFKRLVNATGTGIAADRDRHAIEADAFLKRSVPRY